MNEMKLKSKNAIMAELSTVITEPNNSSDFNQWLHAMKMVARLPGGMPPEFRRKLWLALADQHLQIKNVDWSKEEEKCLGEEWYCDDEELGIQIEKDLHRTGSSLFSGPSGSINQVKLKRLLVGYTRWNPDVGYCQGFNMLGALILQIMDKNEVESLKLMIFLIDGILPREYFCGSLDGLQVDMAVFQDILAVCLPGLSNHLRKLQGSSGEGQFEPPLINVFTMQWFLTLFCTCLPLNCVLRVWDLVLIEGSDILLRTALAIWGSLEERILHIKSADDFYCKMGTLSGELLNGHLFDSNGLIQKVVDLGPIADIQKMRSKYFYNVTPWKDKPGFKLFYSDEDYDSDDDSHLQTSNSWAIRLGRRSAGNSTQSSITSPANSSITDTKERLALDISLLKKQYNRLRERQRQAQIILRTASKHNIGPLPTNKSQINHLLLGKNAIVSTKGRRVGPAQGTIPPSRKSPNNKYIRNSGEMTSLTIPLDTNQLLNKSLGIKNKKEQDNNQILIRSSSAISNLSGCNSEVSTKSRNKSESSSYSEASEGNSSTSTSLCDDDIVDVSKSPSIELSPEKYFKQFQDGMDDKASMENLFSENCSEFTYYDFKPLDDETNKPNLVGSLRNETDNKIDLNADDVEKLKEISIDRNTYLKDKYSEHISIERQDMEPRNMTNIPDLLECVSIDEFSDTKSTITNTDELSRNTELSEYLSTLKPSGILVDKPDSTLVEYCDPIKVKNYSIYGNIEDVTDINTNKDITEKGITNEYFERITSSENNSHILSLSTSSKSIDKCTKGSISQDFHLQRDRNISDDINKSASNTSVDICKYYSKLGKLIENNTVKLGEPSRNKRSIRPKSCPSALVKMENILCNKDRVMRMIEENSLILSKIQNKGKHDFEVEMEEKWHCSTSKTDDSIETHYVRTSQNENDYQPDNENQSKIINELNHVIITSEPTISTIHDTIDKLIIDDTYDYSIGKLFEKYNVENEQFKRSIPLILPNENESEFQKHDKNICLIKSKDTSEINPKSDESSGSKELSKTETSNFSTNSIYLDYKSEINVAKAPSNNLDIKDITSNSFATLLNEVEEIDADNKFAGYSITDDIRFDTSTTICNRTISDEIDDDANLSHTLSSIKNTIQSIDYICQTNQRYQTAPREDLSSDISSPKKNKVSPQLIISYRNYFPENEINTVVSETMPKIRRFSRGLTRDYSPRKRYDYENSLDNNLKSDTKNNLFQNDVNIESYKHTPSTSKSSFNLNLNEDNNSTSDKSVNSEKFQIRHTTVTATFYDRFLSQKKEKGIYIEKSPTSPIITKSYLDSLKPPRFNRSSKSAENSPTRLNWT